MRLLSKTKYKEVEEFLRSYNFYKNTGSAVEKSIDELKEFFKNHPHIQFIQTYYIDRNKYKNRYPNNADLFRKICNDLYIEEPTGYVIKKEIIYKAAMLFYKNEVIK